MFRPYTKEEAKKFLYGGTALTYFKPERCAWQMDDYYQCLRSPGKGPDGLYCWQHAKKMESPEEWLRIIERG